MMPVGSRSSFDAAYGFSEGLAPVESAGQWGYDDRAGKTVIPPRFALAGNFHDGAARVAESWRSGWEYIDMTGRAITAARYEEAKDFHDGLAAVALRENGALRRGFIGRSGAVAIAPHFSFSRGFSEGLASVDGGFIDRTGAVVIATRFVDTGDFSEGVAPVAGFIARGAR
jgi:hypothetical protein